MTICLALDVSEITWKLSPTSGRLSRPITSTGMDGSASFTGLPRSPNMARTFLKRAPQIKKPPPALSQFGFQRSAKRRTVRIRLKILYIGYQENHFQQQVKVLAHFGRNG